MKAKITIVPYAVMAQAVNGDVVAMDYILKHFEGYMISLCQKTLVDEMGNAYHHIDLELKRRLETKLIISILNFDLNVA